MSNKDQLRTHLQYLLSEPLESVRKRQEHTFEQTLGGLDRPFVLFGAGQLGRKTLAILQRTGFIPEAFIDNNPALWGSKIASVPVLSPAQLAKQTTEKNEPLPGVITTIWSGEATDRMADRLAPLRLLGFDRIALFGHLAWCYPQLFLPHYFLDHPEKVIADVEKILKAFDLLSDEDSRRLFVDHVAWRLTLDYDRLPLASSLPIYFNFHFTNDNTDEVLYDVGAFDGDSVQGYLDSGRHYREIHAFEPTESGFLKLKEELTRLSAQHPGLHAHQLAVGNAVGSTFIETDNGPASRIGHGTQKVSVTTLDHLSQTIPLPSFIKIDIEGFEPQCLEGARLVIQNQHPVIAVCVYHEQAHLWSILLQLFDYYDGYRFSLCSHLNNGWDLVLYAVPPDRLPSNLQD